MAHFVYKLIPPRPTFATDQTDSEQTVMAEHVEYWKHLFDEGIVVAFGPVLEPGGLWGLAVVEAATAAEVNSLAANDPAVSSKMATFEVHPLPRAIVRLPERPGNVYCASVAYPTDTQDFDFDYFRSHHAPMFAQLLGDNCVRFEVHRALATPGAPPPPFIAAAYFWVRSPAAFGATLAEHGAALYADIAKFSGTQPVRGWAEVMQPTTH